MKLFAQTTFSSSTRRAIAIAALLSAGLAATALTPTAASSIDTPAVATRAAPPTYTEWLSEGVDWSRVQPAPVDSGATVAAYER